MFDGDFMIQLPAPRVGQVSIALMLYPPEHHSDGRYLALWVQDGAYATQTFFNLPEASVLAQEFDFPTGKVTPMHDGGWVALTFTCEYEEERIALMVVDGQPSATKVQMSEAQAKRFATELRRHIHKVIAGQGGVGFCRCCGSIVFDTCCYYCEYGEHPGCSRSPDRGTNIQGYTGPEWLWANPDLAANLSEQERELTLTLTERSI